MEVKKYYFVSGILLLLFIASWYVDTYNHENLHSDIGEAYGCTKDKIDIIGHNWQCLSSGYDYEGAKDLHIINDIVNYNVQWIIISIFGSLIVIIFVYLVK